MTYPAGPSASATRVAEDDAGRSERVRDLLFGPDASVNPVGPPRRPVPRLIIQYWHDPADRPSDVAACIESWRPFVERGFRHVLFDDMTARSFIAMFLGGAHVAAFDRCGHPAMRCDYFRLCSVLLSGGVYIDADECYVGADGSVFEEFVTDGRLLLQPRCFDHASKSTVSTRTFLNEQHPPPSWMFYVENSPIIAPPGHPVIRLALERATRLLLRAPAWDLYATTGPGNVTASLVAHSLSDGEWSGTDFGFLLDWDSVSQAQWPLSYRSDERNWRLWCAARRADPERT